MRRFVRLLTAAEFQQLAEVPAELEWFANSETPTQRAYQIDIRDFLTFVGIFARPGSARSPVPTSTPGAPPTPSSRHLSDLRKQLPDIMPDRLREWGGQGTALPLPGRGHGWE